MHPWGREAECSLQDLLGYFTRCLRHGEWELAAACVPQLVASSGSLSSSPSGEIPSSSCSGGLSDQLRDIVKAIICHPYPLAWETMGSPHRLAWFWLQVLETWTKDQVPVKIRTELEFLLLLEELVDDVPDATLKELHVAFLDSQSERKGPEASGDLGAGVVSCLEALLERKRPRLARALALALQGPQGDAIPSLQNTFIRYLTARVGKPEKREGWAEEICSLLALMPTPSEQGGGAQMEALCEALWAARNGPLREERVLSSLFRPHSHTALTLYCSTALRLQRDRLLRDAPATHEDLPEAEKLHLSLCCHSDRPSAWKSIYFECLSSGKHFLEQVLVTALDLVRREDFPRLQDLLRGEFQPLSRLLLLLAWTHCRSLDSAHILLSILHHNQALASDSVLKDFADVLSSQLRVLQWCVLNNPGISQEAVLSQLHSLDTHSALHVLLSLTPLARYEERRVLELLQPAPSRPEETDTLVPPSLATQRNVVLYQGFCAMKYALYALCVNAHRPGTCLECEGSTEGQRQPSAPSEDCLPQFQHFLSECQLYLEALPAMFRLELLENIFSLLFLSSTDFTPQNQKEIPAGAGVPTGGLYAPGSKEVGKHGTGGTKSKMAEEEDSRERWEPDFPSAVRNGCLDLGHLTRSCPGFLVDVPALEGFLKLLREGLEGVCILDQRAGQEQAEVAEGLGCSVTAETFGARLQRLSKYTAEAQWRLQIVASNQTACKAPDRLPQAKAGPRPAPLVRQGSSSSSLRRRRRPGKLPSSTEQHNGELSPRTSGTSEGCVAVQRCVEEEEEEGSVCSGAHSWLVPAMLAPPESLLVSCIRRGNFMEAHEVVTMFALEGSSCCGELVFMERYKEVLVELGRVEQKIETQSLSSSSSSSEGLGAVGPAGSGRSRVGSSGRSTLQAIGSAAAAGMAFYSISDVGERLLSTAAHPVPCLEEGYWLGLLPGPCPRLLPMLEELSPAAMAAFDLACCHCQLWKTSRQLLDTAERRLGCSLEARGLRVDPRVPHPEGVRGFPMVLQQFSKILNHAASNKGPAMTEGSGEEQVVAGPFGCSIQEALLSCHPVLSEEGIAAWLSLSQRLELTLPTLASATDAPAEARAGGAVMAALVEQAGLKPSELETHPVRTSMKQLLRSLDQLCPFEPDSIPARPDYMRSFLDYVNVLTSVLVRSLGSEDQSVEVKLGNPLLVLLQAPSQLLAHLLFERQVSPDRLLSLLQQEGLHLSVQQVVLERCCEALPVWSWGPGARGETGEGSQGDKAVFGSSSLEELLQQHAQEHLSTLGLAEAPSDPSSESESSPEEITTSPLSLSSSPPLSSPTATSPSSSSFLLTPSSLSFLKSRSPLLAALACLSASRARGATRAPPSGWSGFSSYFSGRKEVALDAEQISREADNLLREFPILRAYLQTMAQPVLGELPGREEAGLGATLCGKPLAGLLLSGLQPGGAQAVAAQAFQQALSAGELGRALSLLELYRLDVQEGALRDRLLACAALEDGAGGVVQLLRVQDPGLRARVALQGLQLWPLSGCLDLLEFCLNEPHLAPALRKDLELSKNELDVYQMMLNLQPPLPWATWQDVRSASKQDPESVLSMMLAAREFSLCDRWLQMYSVSEQLTLQLRTEHLLHLLEQGHMQQAYQLLEALSDTLGLEVCERALDRRPGLAACHFLSDYLTLHFQSRVSPARQRHIHALHLGSKVLLTLPQSARQDYFHLLAEPLLMLEQLLMNLKVDWVQVALRTLRPPLLGQEAGLGPEDVDRLLAQYAGKALDFPYAPRERSRSDSVISLQEALSQCPALDSCPPSPKKESPTSSTGSTPIHTPLSSERGREPGSAGRRQRSPAQFQPPDKPPPRRDWVPDPQQHVCMVCQRERFTMFNRRHHCRRCGRLVCQACSGHRMPVEGCTEEEVRVCDQCYTFFHPDSDEELEEAVAVTGSPVSPGGGGVEGGLQLPEVHHRMFRLSTDPTENVQLHSEFYYEQAPSASLCVAILSLHSDQMACGHQLIAHCRSLSRKLTSPEVDARLLTDIMRQLIFSAKLMFVTVGRSQDLALCDSYISKVDVLKILVAANYKDVPSLDDILETSAVTRLRNQLLEAEHYQLAVEVSTKSGLDPGGVWHAWGMASLKAGQLSGAREKFSRCLKVPVDRNQLTLGPRLLQDIIQHLESAVQPVLTMLPSEDILASLRELEEALAEPGPPERPESPAPLSPLLQESLHYLLSYGTHLALVSFYMRHGHMREALTHLLNKQCPEEVFLEGILQPSLERGQLGALQGLLEGLDPGQEACGRYLLASCQMLQRRGHFHTLYQLQQFMMDHVRAAMTCICFFTRGAQSYLQLGEQQRWLVRAKEHLKTFLQEQQARGAASRKKSTLNSFRKKMSSSDVSRHMNTIELQLEVTRFLHRCENASQTTGLQTSASASSPGAPSTLFGGSAMKIDVACKVMLGGKNIEEGFGIAYRVIQDFQLDALAVYVRAGQRLVRQRQYGAVRQLLKCVGESGTATKSDCDAIVLGCVSIANKGPADAKELESLILEVKSTENKIKAYLQCSKLRSAYLQAVKLDASRAGPLVQEVLQASEGAGDSVMQGICRQWLSEHQEKAAKQRPSRPNAR